MIMMSGNFLWTFWNKLLVLSSGSKNPKKKPLWILEP